MRFEDVDRGPHERRGVPAAIPSSPVAPSIGLRGGVVGALGAGTDSAVELVDQRAAERDVRVVFLSVVAQSAHLVLDELVVNRVALDPRNPL